MRYHQPTVDYVARRTADGRTKREIIRRLKRFLAREIYQRVIDPSCGLSIVEMRPLDCRN